MLTAALVIGAIAAVWMPISFGIAVLLGKAVTTADREQAAQAPTLRLVS